LSACPNGSGRAPFEFTAPRFIGPGFKFRADTVNQHVDFSDVGKLVAISTQWVNSVKGRDNKANGSTVAGIRLM
jgi:hypothetical protein